MKKPKFPWEIKKLIFLRNLFLPKSFSWPYENIELMRKKFNEGAKIGNNKYNQKREIAFTQDIVHNGNKLRIYRNSDANNQKVIINFHGGGMVYYDLEAQDYNCRHICEMADCVVVNADYRLAPEHKFPAGHDDALEVLKWVNANIKDYGGDAKKIITMGDSAGGNLAASLAASAREDNGLSLVLGQILLYPWCDSNSEKYQSYKDYGSKSYILNTRDIKFFSNAYFKNKEDLENPRANLMKQENLKGLPPALILTAEFDPLCSEGQEYGQKLAQAGVNVKAITYPNSVHGFMSILDAGFKNREPLFEIIDFIKSL